MPTSPKKYKIIFLGNSNVGKTSLISQFICNKVHNPTPTIAIDFLTTTHTVNGELVKLQLWDTAGQERFRSIVGNYVRNTFLAVVVFDLNDVLSAESAEEWITDFIYKYNDSKVKVLIVGNKKDLVEECGAQDALNKGKQLSEKYKTNFVKASALCRAGIEEMVQGIDSIIAENMAKRADEKETKENAIKIDAEERKRCCW